MILSSALGYLRIPHFSSIVYNVRKGDVRFVMKFTPAQIGAILTYHFGEKPEFETNNIRKKYGRELSKKHVDIIIDGYKSHNRLIKIARIKNEERKSKTTQVNMSRIEMIGHLRYNEKVPLSLEEISQIFGISKHQVQKICKEYEKLHEIKRRRPQIYTKRKRSNTQNIDINELRAAASQLSRKEVAEYFGVSEYAIMSLCKQHGIKLHTSSPRQCLKCGVTIWRGNHCTKCSKKHRVELISKWNHTEKGKQTLVKHYLKNKVRQAISKGVPLVLCPICKLPQVYDPEDDRRNGLKTHIGRVHKDHDYGNIMKQVQEGKLVLEQYNPNDDKVV